jgi:disulfide bond formation protein DsbB
MRKRLLFLLLFLLSGMILIGCGGDSGSDGDPGPSEENAAAEEPAMEEEASEELVGDATTGKAHYDSVCIACHGPDATGMPNLGKDLTTSEFTQNLSDAELVEFIKMGRSVGDPANTTGVDMPPKGGSPSLSDQDIYDIVAYLRTLEE